MLKNVLLVLLWILSDYDKMLLTEKWEVQIKIDKVSAAVKSRIAGISE